MPRADNCALIFGDPMRIATFCLLLFAIGRVGYAEDRPGDRPIPKKNEIVMEPGSRLTATTPIGKIIIDAGRGLRRSYTWDGATRFVEMWPRDKRWYGSLGIYYPGLGNHWREHK